MSARTFGLLLFLGFGALFLLIGHWITNPESYPFSYVPAGFGGAILIAIPGVLALKGLIEAITDRPFYELESAWAGLARWQRALGGLLIVVLGSALMLVIIVLLFG